MTRWDNTDLRLGQKKHTRSQFFSAVTRLLHYLSACFPIVLADQSGVCGTCLVNKLPENSPSRRAVTNGSGRWTIQPQGGSCNKVQKTQIIIDVS